MKLTPKITKIKVTISLLVLFLFLFVFGCRSDSGSAIPAGAEGGACYQNGTCNEGLVCRSDLCVEDGSTGDPEEVLGNCLECGEAACASEAEKCDAAEGCGEVISCWVKCMDDASCVNACDTSMLTAEDLQLVNQYFQCIATNCVSECSASTENPEDTSDTSGLEPCTSEGDIQGSCVSDSLEICTDGFWQKDSCDGCQIVTPNTTCERVYSLAFEEQGTDLVSVTPTQMEFEQTTESVSAEWYLESDQMGVIQFVFSEPLDPSRIELSYSSRIEFVTLEVPGGAGGCQYEVNSSGRLERYLIIGSSGIDWYGCWGDFSSYTTENPDTLTIMSIRTPVTSTNETVSLTIHEVLL
jgi:hypothetical protein